MLMVVDHYGTVVSYGVLHTTSNHASSPCRHVHLSLWFMCFCLLVAWYVGCVRQLIVTVQTFLVYWWWT